MCGRLTEALIARGLCETKASASRLIRLAPRRAYSSGSREAFPGALLRLACLLCAVARRGVGLERADEPLGRFGDLVDGARERRLVDTRWARRTAQLANELQRGRANLVVGRWRLEVGQRLDVATHRRASCIWSWLAMAGGEPHSIPRPLAKLSQA